MGLQLIFVVETNKKCKSDWIYIKDTIEHFFKYDRTQVKFTPVYMNGKGNYRNKDKEISTVISQYKVAAEKNQSRVIFCFDCDDYDSKQEDAVFIRDAKKYCDAQVYDFIWFCKDIERVYLGKKVDDNQKQKESAIFKAKELVNVVDERKLCAKTYRINTSNIINVLQKYLTHK